MTIPSAAEAEQHLERASNEVARLFPDFSQRSRADKKRMALLEKLVPKLKRLAREDALARTKPEFAARDDISEAEMAVLQSLIPPPRK